MVFKIHFFGNHWSPKFIWLLYLNEYSCTSIWNLLTTKKEEMGVKVTIIKMNVLNQVLLLTFVFDRQCDFSLMLNSQNCFRSAQVTLWLSCRPYYCHFAQELLVYICKGFNELDISFPSGHKLVNLVLKLSFNLTTPHKPLWYC